MPQRTVKIEHRSPVDASVEIDGHDVSNVVRGYRVEHTVGELPRVTLDVLSPIARTTLADKHVVVDLPAETEEALVLLGWTPPGKVDARTAIKQGWTPPADIDPRELPVEYALEVGAQQ